MGSCVNLIFIHFQAIKQNTKQQNHINNNKELQQLMEEGWGKLSISQNGKMEDRGLDLGREMCTVLFAVHATVLSTLQLV